MISRRCDSVPSEADSRLSELDRSEPLRKIKQYASAESYPQDHGFGEDSLANFMESLLPGTVYTKGPGADFSSHEFSLRPPDGRPMRRSSSYLSRRQQNDLRLFSSTIRKKRLRIDGTSKRSTYSVRSEFCDLDTCYRLNSIICDDPECEIPSCSESGCEGNEIVACNYSDHYSSPAACRKDCFDHQDSQLKSPQRQWPTSEVRKFEIIKSKKVHTNNMASYLVTSASPSPTTPLLSNISTMYSPQLEVPTPNGSFSPPMSYQDPSDISFSNVETYFPNSNGSAPGSGLDQSWSNSGQYSDSQIKSLSFQCPWLDCSHVIETSEQWNQHFHQEHIDPQMVYSCPLQTESCEFPLGTNPLAHLESNHGFNISLNDENGYRCPNDSCQQGMENFDQISFHNHLDHVHATPGSGQLQCRLWACGNWFDDPNELVSHAMENHTIPVWTKPVEDQISTPEPSPGIHTYLYEKSNKVPIDESCVKKIRDREIDNHRLSSQFHESDNQLSSMSSPEKLASVGGAEKLNAHMCLWNDLRGIACQMDFCSENDLQNHIKESHLESLDNKTGYFCRWDGCTRQVKLGSKAGFSQRGKLERHMATHTNFKCSLCDICGVSFSAPQAMRQHRRLHTGERPWKCQHCDKKFTQQSACTVHERTHTNEKPLECPICFKKFSESSNLTKHRKTHGEKGAHVCTFASCRKTFHRFDQLKRHQLTHVSEPNLIANKNYGESENKN
ncbi:putative zinc finger-containing transcription facto [Golovinomyces cichoracearum]|uniref:Putative zinc finger-containing transcription facto n=1 Tax=Golovinomyces cichoracearum TaxID=62708 RepID=A0A420IDG5_9PEZI|nr:putative zinc finger-containing transcription facto [Golovinomyces cichoracearum]